MIKTIIRSSVTTIVLFVAAAALIIAGSIGAAQGAPRIQSEYYGAEAILTHIHVQLTERYEKDATPIPREGKDDLLKNLLSDGEKFEIGKEYDYFLAARNDDLENHDGIPEYVRVTVTKYWVDENGNKDPNLNPEYIHLNFVETEGWRIDTRYDSPETTVLYYDKYGKEGSIVNQNMDTGYFTDKLSIDSKVLTEKKIDEFGNATYTYKDKEFVIKAVVDAVQTHNEEQAIKGVWGPDKLF